MKLELLNRSHRKMPRRFLQAWTNKVAAQLSRRKKWPGAESLVVVFVEPGEIRRLNREYRGKDKVTDVLSFSSDELDSLGELVICPNVVARQAVEHDLSFQDELGYMVLHGILHLLGYEHERDRRKAKLMFELQDSLFEALCRG